MVVEADKGAGVGEGHSLPQYVLLQFLRVGALVVDDCRRPVHKRVQQNASE